MRLSGVFAVALLLAVCGCGAVFEANRPPEFDAASCLANGQAASGPSAPLPVRGGDHVVLSCRVVDPDSDIVSFVWSASDGGAVTVLNPPSKASKAAGRAVDGIAAVWKAPSDKEGPFTVTCTANDSSGGISAFSYHLLVTNTASNHAPSVSFPSAEMSVARSGTFNVQVTTADPDASDAGRLAVKFFATGGSVAQDSTDQTKAVFTAPASAGDLYLYAVVQDAHGGASLAVLKVKVTE
jgi:hypothetical protein